MFIYYSNFVFKRFSIGQFGRVKGHITCVACISKCKPLAPGSELEGKQFTRSLYQYFNFGCMDVHRIVCVHAKDKQIIMQ